MDPPATTTHPAPKPKPSKPKPTTAETTGPISGPPKHTSSTVPRSSSLNPSATSTTLDPSPTSTPSPASSQNGLTTPAIAGIAAAGGLIVLFILSVIICKKRRARQYAKRNHGYDPSRDPINPNDVLPLENKFDQRTQPLGQGDSGIVAYPLAVRNSDQDTKNDLSLTGQSPRQQPAQQAGHQEYQHYEDHIQSHFAPESPGLAHRGLVASAGAPGERAQLPTPISTNSSPSLDNPRSPPLMSPSQRAQQQYLVQGSMSSGSPRSHMQHQPRADTRPSQENMVVNDMGNQFILQSNNSAYAPSGSGSPNSLGSQQRRGPPGPNNQGSPYSSPRQGPSHPSPRQQHMQYQPPQPYPQQPIPQQPYSQYPPQSRPIYGTGQSPSMIPQQRPAYPGGGQMRSPPMGPRGPGYAQVAPSPSANYSPY
ncbi:hypothetical protein EDD11_000573 [Mortierella claussenii]|nr:hypothetical protein EDD11_000573 [Mortierella claussenii]